MDNRQFIEALYENSTGYISLWEKSSKRTCFINVSETDKIIDTAMSIETDVYFGVCLGALPKESGRFVTEDITSMPGLYLDIDIAGDGHKNINLPQSVSQALEFINDLPLGPSIIVNSGGGLHVYYLFNEPWEIETPEERAQAQAVSKGWQDFIRTRTSWTIDSTHDLPRVLRLPGTINGKIPNSPMRVDVITHNDFRYNPSDFQEYACEIAKIEKREKFHRNPSDGPSSLILDNCVFLQAIRDNAAQVTEPQWVAALSNLARCSDGPEACHAMSAPYPGYTYQETEAKISHALNNMHPQSCQYIQNVLGFNQCPECGVKAPVAWALKRKRKQENPIPDDFWNPKPDEPELSKFTDLGNAEYFSRYYAGRVRHCAEMDKWLIWDGKRWNIDGSNQITVMAGKCVRSMYDFLSKIDDDAARKQLFKHAMKSEDANKLAAMIKLARGYMSVSVDTLDQDPWLLNSPSGIIDLKTGELLPHDPARNMTKMISATYDPAAMCPTFEKFIDSTFESNASVIGFMRRFLGYCLTGDTREQQFVIAWGSMGRNGKGTLLNLISDILQDYAKATPTDVLYAKKFDKPSNDIARLAGARFVLASEGERGKRLDEPLVKKMTGQDILAARFLYKETFEFMPQFKLVMMTNEKPTASEDDAALWARIQLVPFNRRFDGENQDKHLKQKLRNPREVSGILNWLIKGCLEWQRTGLNPPEEVLHATREYRDENDKLKAWIEECCDVRPDGIAAPKDLYRNFQAWSLANGEKFIMIFKNFNTALIKRGFERFTGAGNVLKMRGIALNSRDLANYRSAEEPF